MVDTLIIIPAFNEEKGIQAVLESLHGFDSHAHVLVVNDGSLDNTLEIISKQQNVLIASHPINLGYGAALQTAYKYASSKGYKYVVQFDADNQHDLSDLRQLIAEMRKDTDDIVIGSRVMGEPKFYPGFRKKIAFWWFTSLIRLLTRKKMTDPTSGLRGLSNRSFTYYSSSNSFPHDFPDADTIIHMILQGFQLREFPIGSKQRLEGTSMHNGILKHAVYMLKVTLSIFVIMMQRRVLDRRKTT